MTHPDIIRLAAMINPNPSILHNHATYSMIEQRTGKNNNIVKHFLYYEQKTAPLPNHYRLSDIHALLQYIHPHHNYSIEWAIFHPYITSDISVYSHGDAPNIVTLTSKSKSKINVDKLNLDPIPNIVDTGQSLGDIIHEMDTQVQTYFTNIHEGIPTKYSLNQLDGCHQLHLTNNARIDIKINIRQNTHDQDKMSIGITSYIRPDIYDIDPYKSHTSHHVCCPYLHDTEHQSTLYHQSINHMFNEILDGLASNLPNHSQHNIATIYRTLIQQQHDPHHPIYASIAHYIEQFHKHYHHSTNEHPT